MLLNEKKIGFALTGSFCMFKSVIPEIENIIKDDAKVLPIMSFNAYNTDTRFGMAKDFINEIETICDNKIIHTIENAEPIGPQRLTDIMVIAPCTGNTLAKLANGISDTPALMSAKSHLRNGNPLVIGVSTNDGLSNNLKNIGILMNIKNIYFIPFRQDNPITKPNSLVLDIKSIIPSIKKALDKEQIQPVLL